MALTHLGTFLLGKISICGWIRK